MAKELVDDQHAGTEIIERICIILEKFHASILQCGLSEQDLIHYLEWFSRNGYNLAVQYSSKGNALYSMRLLESIIMIMNLYPVGLGPDALSDIQDRKFWCRVMAAMVSVTLGRGSNDANAQVTHYTTARTNIQLCREYTKIRGHGASQGTLPSRFKEAWHSLLVLDFEAAIFLRDVGSTQAILDGCEGLDSKRICMLADLVISSGQDDVALYNVFRQIMNMAIRSDTTCQAIKHFRWLRCLCQLGIKCGADCAEFITSKALELGHGLTSELGAEMKWLAIAIFNQALDYYIADEMATGRRWYEEALRLARGLELEGWDTDSLSTHFTQRSKHLTWD
ncbi:hypothetical protein FQN49_002112 [Arthroderma sp. PD_2]|nr:hypothetical protein FQN49_002112 [Arthroderma sp. PD_2]